MVAKAQEKRRSPRLNIRAPIRYQVRGTPIFDNAITDNISNDGISFISHKFIPASTFITLEINILSRILRLTGRVARTSNVPRSYRTKVGIEFLEIDPKEKDYLSDYLDMHKERF